ncbi:MAG: carbamate kinase [Anaerolineae bacterium]
MDGQTAVVALGGNALIKDKQHQSVQDQFERMGITAVHIVDMIEAGWNIVITHGNGPQVGFCLLRSELARGVLDELPMEVCGANTQGVIGYMAQQQLHNELQRRGMAKSIVTVITQTEVDPRDPAFQHPSKPVGPFYDEAQAKKYAQEGGWNVAEDAGRGWRRVVPSPRPKRIVEVDAIRALASQGFVVVCTGGGGIPVVADENGILRGTAAVIDKDFGSSLLALSIHADLFLISTAVEKVALNFRQPNQVDLERIGAEEAEGYLAEGHFAAGSMGPKIEASVAFVRASGKPALITSPEAIGSALRGETGTWIVPQKEKERAGARSEAAPTGRR